ncbi:nitrile hydratase subunit beta [Granulosicoccus antarcticus]|uniref:Nitrile hydratase subunit beta n=1 Tax=Granulosicoccus antarcticus IMCC3135 TaxID=1192854 RepID=A0A2Z2NKJ2_9GAMM|nr:nitrile hydratase subunit beta [Granulosicoccus antarcticus]ASJ71035.1 Low-molecular weight cobalt-containing nitrile hydratase subunit beta [Granulosicoccus antarcticus IMCC3135]
MNGVHDMGGLQGFGPLAAESETQTLHDDHLFDHDWERDVLTMTLAMGATGTWNLDESRSVRESLPPAQYLSIGYYRVWLQSLERLLLNHQLITAAEQASGKSMTKAAPVKRVLLAKDVSTVLRKGAPVNRAVDSLPAFALGEQVRVRNLHSSTHTRLPAYIRNHTGIVHKIHGAHIYPDAHALGQGEQPQWLYNIRFSATELWGEQETRRGDVHVDCWEPYLCTQS